MIATPATTRKATFFTALETIEHRPAVQYLRNPQDYLAPDRATLELTGAR